MDKSSKTLQVDLISVVRKSESSACNPDPTTDSEVLDVAVDQSSCDVIKEDPALKDDPAVVQPLLEANRQQNSNSGKYSVPRAVRLLDAIATTIIFRSLDVIVFCTTLTLLIRYRRHENSIYVLLTALFYAVPSVLLNSISLFRVIYNSKKETANFQSKIKLWEIPLFTFLPQVAAYSRLRFMSKDASSVRGYESDDSQRARLEIINLANEAIALYLASNFVQSVTLFFLQWFYLSNASDPPSYDAVGYAPVFSLIWSLLCLSLTMVAWEENILFVEWPVAVITFLWKFFTNISRLQSLAFCLSVCWPLFVGLCAGHWLAFTILIFYLTKFQRWRRVLLSLVMGFFFIVSDMDVSCKHDFPRRIFYYLVTLIENIAMLTVWIVLTVHGPWYYYWYSTAIYFFYFAGIFFLRFQYEFHYRTRTKSKPLKTYMFGCCLGYPEYDNLNFDRFDAIS